MNFPEQVTFRLLDSKTKKTINNVAVILILYAHKKNNYSIEAKVSDIQGLVSFTKYDCLRDIENSKRFYLMDYLSTLEECLPKLSIKILASNTINSVVSDRRENKDIYEGYWNCDEEFLHVLENAENYKYINETYNFTEQEVQNMRIIDIMLCSI